MAALFGPPGAGKTTAARSSGLVILDWDDPQWRRGGQSAFTAALRQVGQDPDARAVVIRSGATATARSRLLHTIRATHAWILLTDPEECHRRVEARHRSRPPLASQHKAIRTWWAAWDHGADVPAWPGTWPADWELEPTMTGPGLAPICTRCNRRHLPGLACWWSDYAQRITRQVLATQGNACWICGELATTADHVIPRSLGGGDQLENLRPACQPCNARRGNTLNPFRPGQEDGGGRGAPLSARFRQPTQT